MEAANILADNFMIKFLSSDRHEVAIQPATVSLSFSAVFLCDYS